ncbi:MAG: PAS domain S-box protein [Acidimicrobiia bacterium]|nr:PAS domain S-box protein [Acidimicrobiia bacterium]
MAAEPISRDIAIGDDLRPLSEVELSDRVMWGLVDSAPDGLLMVDDCGHIILINRQIEELFGYDRGELLGQSVDVLLPPASRQVHRAHRTRYRAEPRVRSMGAAMDLQGCRSDGTLFPVEVSLSPLAGDHGEALVIAAVRDVTSRVAAEALDAEVRHGLDVVEDGVFMFDADTLRFRYVNQGAVNQVGYSAAELLTMTPIHIKPEFTEASFRELLEPLLANETQSVHFTTVHRRKDGSDRPVEIVLQGPPPPFHSTQRSCVALVRDISQRLEDERQLTAARQQASLLADRERLARDMHDTVIQELFATGIALQATVSRIDDQATAERVLAAVDSIDETIKQIRGTIFGMRTYGQWENGVRNEILQVAESASEALGFEPSVGFEGTVDDLPGPVVSQLLPTLREVLSNVARHARASGVEVTVTATDDDAVVEVLDDGVGISGDAADAPTGHGLGNIRGRALDLGGSCVVERRDDGGTRVVWRVRLERTG